MIRIDEERGCVRIVFESPMTLPEFRECMESECGRVDGLLEAPELSRAGDCYALCVRNRESLKAYACHHILNLSDYLNFLYRMRSVLEHLIREGMSVYNCIWDVDCIFVRESPEDSEILYIPGFSEQGKAGRETPFCDMLTVLALRVAEIRESAVRTLSDVLRDFSEWEKNVLLEQRYNAEPFEHAERVLLPFCKPDNRVLCDLKKLRIFFQNRKKEIGFSGTLTLSGEASLKRRKWTVRAKSGIKQEIRLGREDSGKDVLRIPFPPVSRRQAILFRDESGWSIADLHSRNGTFLDGVRLKENMRYPLRRGSVIWFGCEQIALRVQY